MSRQNPFMRTPNDRYCNSCQNNCPNCRPNNCNDQPPCCEDRDDCHDKDKDLSQIVGMAVVTTAAVNSVLTVHIYELTQL